MYTLKPPFKVNCFRCQKKLVVNFSPPLQRYSNKNHWGYWTDKKENKDKHTCDACLIDLYRNHKELYLNSITDDKKRRTFRTYFGGSVSLLTRTQQKQLKKGEVGIRSRLRSKGIDLDEDSRLKNQLENWRQTILKLIEENSLKDKRIKELEKKLTKKQKKK